MSVRTMARVWEFSRHSGTNLLMLLAIADFADDDGKAYPSVQTLAEKCRMKSRNANVILAALRASGELEVKQNEGPHGTNRYRVVFASQALQSSAGVQNNAGLQRNARTPAKECSKPLQRNADEPSVNHQEPSNDFLRFWDVYGKKVGKSNAVKEWKKIRPSSETVEVIIEAATSYASKTETKFRLDPERWIKYRRWEDESPAHQSGIDGLGEVI